MAQFLKDAPDSARFMFLVAWRLLHPIGSQLALLLCTIAVAVGLPPDNEYQFKKAIEAHVTLILMALISVTLVKKIFESVRSKS